MGPESGCLCFADPPVMKLSIWIASLVLLVVAGCGTPEAATSADEELGPSFELASLGGDTVSSSAFEGKVLLLEFWATWCTPCVAQARILEPLHRDFEERGVEFLAISVGEDAGTVAEYVDRSPFSYPVLIDPEDELSARIGIYALPTVMIVDRSGKVAYQQPGLSSGEVIRRVLEETLEG